MIRMREDFILKLYSDLEKLLTPEDLDEELTVLINDIRKYLKGENEYFKRNQQVIGKNISLEDY